MPTYSYACTECDNRFDVVQSFTDQSLTVCPVCSGRLRKLFNTVGIVFKGSGFYRNDSREGAGKGTGDAKDGPSKDADSTSADSSPKDGGAKDSSGKDSSKDAGKKDTSASSDSSPKKDGGSTSATGSSTSTSKSSTSS